MNMDCSCERCEYKKNPWFVDFSICGINLKHLLGVQLDREDQVVQLSPKERKKSVNINFHPVVEMDHWECGFKPTKTWKKSLQTFSPGSPMSPPGPLKPI